LWFAPTVPFNSRSVSEILSLSIPLFREFDFDFYLALLIQNARSLVPLMCIYFEKNSAEEQRAKALLDSLGQVTRSAGYLEYRTSLLGMREVISQGGEYESLLARIKESFDPRNIIAPGKYGIVAPTKN
jgi:4-cresol dehydrogenase (hydroxylating)